MKWFALIILIIFLICAGLMLGAFDDSCIRGRTYC